MNGTGRWGPEISIRVDTNVVSKSLLAIIGKQV